WLVVPINQIEHFRQKSSLMPCSVPLLRQHTLADFIRVGHFWRHLKKLRLLYALRRCGVEAALAGRGVGGGVRGGGGG
ncbi:PLP-dependent aminotransferase family protein, partial [Salmonella enterica subsp. enterica serovar Infantis]